MALHTIKTIINNSPTGTPSPEDGVMMLVVHGVVGASSLVLDTAYLGSSLASFAALGITNDFDVVNGLTVYQQVSEFYAEAGDGAYLWLVVTAKAGAYATYVASTTFKNLIRGTIQADITKRAKMIGICYDPPTAQQSTADFPSDVTATLIALQATQVAMAADGFPFSAILDGYNMSSTATSNTIQTMATKACPSVSTCITGSTPNGVASVGAALGRLARISIGHGFGETDDGPISLTTTYLTNGVSLFINGAAISAGTALTATHSYMVLTGPVAYNGTIYSFGSPFYCSAGVTTFTGGTVADLTSTGTVAINSPYLVVAGPITYNGAVYGTGQKFVTDGTHTTFTGGIVQLLNSTDVTKLFQDDYNNFGSKQYLFYCPYYQLSGLYWNDGATCDLAVNPLSTQEYNRVGNHFLSALLNFLALLKGKNVPIDNKTGLVEASFVKTQQQIFFDTYIKPALIPVAPNTVGDISDGSLVLIGTPNGNQVNWTYTLTIIGTPLVGSANGTIVFSNTI